MLLSRRKFEDIVIVMEDGLRLFEQLLMVVRHFGRSCLRFTIETSTELSNYGNIEERIVKSSQLRDYLVCMKNLKELKLSEIYLQNNITIDDVTSPPPAVNLPWLTKVYVRSCVFAPRFSNISTLIQADYLEEFEWTANRYLTGEVVSASTFYACFPAVSSGSVTKSDMQWIRQSRLQHLTVKAFHDRDIDLLLPNNVRTLDLANVELNDVDFNAIILSIRLNKLRVCVRNVTVVAVKQLERLILLEELDISDGNRDQLQALVTGRFENLKAVTIRNSPNLNLTWNNFGQRFSAVESVNIFPLRNIEELRDMIRDLTNFRSLSLKLNCDTVTRISHHINNYPLHRLTLSGSNQNALIGILRNCGDSLIELVISKRLDSVQFLTPLLREFVNLRKLSLAIHSRCPQITSCITTYLTTPNLSLRYIKISGLSNEQINLDTLQNELIDIFPLIKYEDCSSKIDIEVDELIIKKRGEIGFSL